ncbi:Leucine-rich repeat-containing protein [Hirschfeldia incana]|nr:Leucine-rich repeat-containing protein [Hirschfeldia incana]
MTIAGVLLIFQDDYPVLFAEDEVVRNVVRELTPMLAFCIVINNAQPVLSGVAVGAGWQAVVAAFCGSRSRYLPLTLHHSDPRFSRATVSLNPTIPRQSLPSPHQPPRHLHADRINPQHHHTSEGEERGLCLGGSFSRSWTVAMKGEDERIDLSDRRLKLVPEALGKNVSLVSLNLSRNDLKSCFVDTVKLRNFRWILFARTIYYTISGLEKLEELDVSSNLLESLPHSFGLLLNLRVLNVSGNKLTYLPESITQCRSLS